jgi:hypothetical protein
MSAPMFETVLCPDCGLPTRLVSVAPTPEPNTDEVTYQCTVCDKELKRNVESKVFGRTATTLRKL